MKLQSINPADYSINGELEVTSDSDIVSAVELANRTKKSWKETTLKERCDLVRQTEDIFKQYQEEIVKSIHNEIGTPVEECLSEVEWDWSYWDWFVTHASEALEPETTRETENSIHQIWYEPIGLSAVITPWNLPFDLFIWGVIPNLLAGNTVIYKASEECLLTGKLIADLMSKSSLPKGVFQAIHGDEKQGKQLIDQAIDLIWFTGSSTVGKQLYAAAGKKFIHASLEMGGSNPVIMFEDADVEKAVNDIINKRFMFCGQTCDADKRLIIHQQIESQVIEALNVRIKDMSTSNMGPLVSKGQLEVVKNQVHTSLQQGAKIVAQGIVNTEKGAYYPPTLLGNIHPSMSVWSEEVFGPVLPYMTFNTEAEAIELANGTQYGLGSQVFTQDTDRALRVAVAIEAGNVDINATGHWLPENPFGGFKLSGVGREHGIHGLRELCQIKVVSRNK